MTSLTSPTVRATPSTASEGSSDQGLAPIGSSPDSRARMPWTWVAKAALVCSLPATFLGLLAVILATA
jgi:hypothetical protein